MRKTALWLIITLSLALTSGMGSRLDAQADLEQTLQQFHARVDQAEITVWLPQQANTGGQDPSTSGPEPPAGWSQTVRTVDADGHAFIIKVLRTKNTDNLLELYTTLRRDGISAGGGAALTVSAALPASPDRLQATGEDFLMSLGAGRVVQETTDQRLYSGAAELEGWGPAIFAGNDKINLQVILRPDDKSGYTHLYLTAPVLITDL